MTEALLERLASETSSGKLTAEICALDTELRREPRVSRRIADFLPGDDTLRSSFPGLLRYLAWTATARFLRPLVNTFDNWRDEERWSRKYCPTCGSLPAMGQLVGHRARAQASAFVRLLLHALAIPANRVPILRNVRTIIGSRPWRLREKNAFALTTANPAVPISKLMMERGARPSFWRIGLRFTSMLSLAIVD